MASLGSYFSPWTLETAVSHLFMSPRGTVGFAVHLTVLFLDFLTVLLAGNWGYLAHAFAGHAVFHVIAGPRTRLSSMTLLPLTDKMISKPFLPQPTIST